MKLLKIPLELRKRSLACDVCHEHIELVLLRKPTNFNLSLWILGLMIFMSVGLPWRRESKKRTVFVDEHAYRKYPKCFSLEYITHGEKLLPAKRTHSLMNKKKKDLFSMPLHLYWVFILHARCMMKQNKQNMSKHFNLNIIYAAFTCCRVVADTQGKYLHNKGPSSSSAKDRALGGCPAAIRQHRHDMGGK